MTNPQRASETIALCVGLEAVGDIANRALLEVLKSAEDCTVMFKSSAHRDVYLARLLDFVHEQANRSLTGTDGSCLDGLICAAETRSYERDSSAENLGEAARRLKAWLDLETTHRMWLPTLNVEATLRVPRTTLLRIAGNQAKHNLARLTGISKTVQAALRKAGHVVELERVPLALDDLREHLQQDYFPYYNTWLTALVNDVRWGIQDYLLPEFQRSYTRVPGGQGQYRYKFPEGMDDEIVQEWYWRLMNHVRTGPYLEKFAAPAYFMKEHLRP